AKQIPWAKPASCRSRETTEGGSAKPPPPVQIRAAPPIFLRNQRLTHACGVGTAANERMRHALGAEREPTRRQIKPRVAGVERDVPPSRLNGRRSGELVRALPASFDGGRGCELGLKCSTTCDAS